MTLDEFFSVYFEPLKLRSRSPHTKRLYRSTLRHLGQFLERAPTLADLSDDQVNRYLSWFRDLPRAAASVNKERCNVLAIWRLVKQQGPDRLFRPSRQSSS